MEESWYSEEDGNEYLETCSYEDMYKGIPYPKIFEPEDEEKEKLIDKILEWDRLLNKLRRKTAYGPRYQIFDYGNINLYNLNKKELKKILRNILNRIYDILAQIGYDPTNRPDLYTKYYPRKYGLKPAYAKYFVRKIAPFYVAQRLFPHYLNEVTLDELDIEFLHYLGTNLSNLCSLELLKLEWLIENGKMKESDVVKTIRKDLLKRPDIEPELRKEVEDEIIRYELTHKSPEQREQLLRLYKQFYEVMRQRRKDEERQQALLRSQGLRRRKRLEQLQNQQPYSKKAHKKKEELRIDPAELMCKVLSSDRRKKKTRKE